MSIAESALEVVAMSRGAEGGWRADGAEMVEEAWRAVWAVERLCLVMVLCWYRATRGDRGLVGADSVSGMLTGEVAGVVAVVV